MVESAAEKYIEQLYADEETTAPLKPVVEDLERRLINQGSFDITESFLFLMFLKPQITFQLHSVLAKTLDSFKEAVSMQDSKLVKEWQFFIFSRGTQGYFVTVAPGAPAAYDLPVPEIESVEDIERQTMVAVHTHPPFSTDSILKPSVIVSTRARKDKRGYAGDLYAFLGTRELNRGSVGGADGRKIPEFIERPLEVILQDNLESGLTRMLFIRESKGLTVLNEQEYIKGLRHGKKRIDRARTEQRVREELAYLGFHSSYLSLPMEQYYGYPFLAPDQIHEVAYDLGIV